MLLELGSGEGRDTLYFARAGLHVTALDYSTVAISSLSAAAERAGLQLHVRQHDVKQPLPFPDATFDACYSHMLFCMALTAADLENLTAEVRRVLRAGGLAIYTARTTEDPDYGLGTHHGDNLYEDEGFIVHFFDDALVHRLATGFDLLGVTRFEEGSLPRRLVRVTMRKPR